MSEAPDKLSIVVQSGAFDRVHYALTMAAAAVAVNTPVTLFFTMWACRALTDRWRDMTVGGGTTTAAELDTRFAGQGLATFEELLSACVALDVRFLVCESGLIAVGLSPADLRADLPVEVCGFVTFLRDASARGMTLFV